MSPEVVYQEFVRRFDLADLAMGKDGNYEAPIGVFRIAWHEILLEARPNYDVRLRSVLLRRSVVVPMPMTPDSGVELLQVYSHLLNNLMYVLLDSEALDVDIKSFLEARREVFKVFPCAAIEVDLAV